MNKCQFQVQAIKRVCAVKKPLLPPEYQQVEYLQSTGTQYINTGVIGNVCSGFDIKIRSVIGGSPHYPFGAQRSQARFYLARDTDYISFVIGISYNSAAVPDGYIYQYIVTNDTIAELRCVTTNGNITISDSNGIVYSGAYNASNVNKINVPIYLYRNNYQNTPDTGGEDYIYYCKIYTLVNGESVLTRDYYPCYRKSDNKPGMYDLVTNTFFTNAGSSEFTVGNNV